MVSVRSQIARVVRGCIRRLPLPRVPPQPANKVRDKDYDQINELIRSLDLEALSSLIEQRHHFSDPVIVLGDTWQAEKVAEALCLPNRAVRLEPTLPEYYDVGPPPDILHAGSPFAPETYETIASLRQTYEGRVFSLFQLLGPVCLFQALEGLVGYHLQPREKVLSYLSRAKIMSPITRLNERFPLQGKRVIEFGPLDGAMSSSLLAHQLASLTCVELRMVNVLKMLAAREYLGWHNLHLVIDDMHLVDGKTYGQFDLVVAHGVYYHSQSPFRFLRNLTTLSDAIWLGGFCANPSRLREPLVALRYEGRVYQAQPYRECRESAGGGVHPVGYYFLPEDLVALFERWGYSVEFFDLEESPANKNAGHYLRTLLRRTRPVTQTGAAGSSSACGGTAPRPRTEDPLDDTSEP